MPLNERKAVDSALVFYLSIHCLLAPSIGNKLPAPVVQPTRMSNRLDESVKAALKRLDSEAISNEMKSVAQALYDEVHDKPAKSSASDAVVENLSKLLYLFQVRLSRVKWCRGPISLKIEPEGDEKDYTSPHSALATDVVAEDHDST